MRKTIWLLLGIALLTGSCLKKDSGCAYSEENIVAPDAEQQAIEDYLSTNSINATKHESGMYYEIVASGGSEKPHMCSQILVSYTGKLTNNTVFDDNAGVVFTLGSLIEGWKKGLKMIGKSGEIRLYIPPSLGYGYTDVKDQNGNVVIPKGSILVFTITLSDFA